MSNSVSAILEHRKLGDIVSGAFTPVLAKHSKSFSVIDRISVGVDSKQRKRVERTAKCRAWERADPGAAAWLAPQPGSVR